MNIKRAIGIIFWAVIAVSIFCIIESKLFGIDLKSTEPANVSTAMWYVSIMSAAIVSAVAAIWYFKSPKTIPSARNGFLFGALAAAIGFVSDIVAFAPHEGGLSILSKYYVEPKYWTAFVLILVSATLVGYIKDKKRR